MSSLDQPEPSIPTKQLREIQEAIDRVMKCSLDTEFRVWLYATNNCVEHHTALQRENDIKVLQHWFCKELFRRKGACEPIAELIDALQAM